MGDSRRNEVFAKFIKRNFPHANSVMVVADGKGKLARKLSIAGYHVHIVEIRERPPHLRSRRTRFTRAEFTRNFDVDTDIIVGMHPDEATAEIVLAGKA